MSETTTETAQDTVQEVAPQSQNEEPTNPEVGNLIAESKKYRSRAQEAESQLAELRASLENLKLKRKKCLRQAPHLLGPQTHLVKVGLICLMKSVGQTGVLYCKAMLKGK